MRTSQFRPKVMYWPNEPVRLENFTQAGGRAAFESMATDGTIAALQIYSYHAERARYDDATTFERAALAAIREFAPDILFIQHVSATDLSDRFWQQLRAEQPKVTIAYHDDDPFGRFSKRIDRATAAAIKAADLTLISGLGRLADLIESYGARAVGYMPSCFAKDHFAQRDPASARKTHDIVAIGSRGTRRRLKFLLLPGARNRQEFVKRLAAQFGERFALYGTGWAAIPSSRGSLPFFAQEEAIQSARISANWDHFDKIPYYFSDRLPIALAAGVPHVTSWHMGYDQLFADAPGFYSCRTISEAVETCRWLLSRPDADLLSEGLAARAWAFARLEANIVFRDGLEQAIRMHDRRLAAA